MRKSRFTEEQIVTAIKEHEAGTPTQELCRRHGIGAADAVPLEGEVRRHERAATRSASSSSRTRIGG